MSRESQRLIIAVLDALSVFSRVFRPPIDSTDTSGLDVDIVTTMEEKEGETLRKIVMATLHMYQVIIFMNDWRRESASADIIFVAS